MKTPLFFAAAVALACVLASSSARADEETVVAPDGIAPAAPTARSYHLRDPELQPAEKRWYGWQTLMIDGISLVTTPVGVGLPGLVFGAPIVHLAHRQYTAALASFAMRAGGALAVAYWATYDKSGGDFRGLDVAIKAISGGILVHSIATAIDAAVFAYDDRPARRAYDARRSTVRVAPSGGTNATGGLTLGLTGTF